MKLTGKRAIITGSSLGIGRSIALDLAREGAAVVINARRADGVDAVVKEVRALGGQASGFACGVDDAGACADLVAHCVKTFGGLDILINNAAIFDGESFGPVDRCSADKWRATMAVNLDGPFNLARAALPHMAAQRWGRIINAGSLAGTGVLGGSAYSVSKAGLAGLTRVLAADYGPYGITVNGYNPEAVTAMGAVDDRETFLSMLRRYEDKGHRTPAHTAYSIDNAGPDAIAPWVTYLCTDDADYLNGQIFALEGRRIGLLAEPEEVRILYRDHARTGPWSLDELALMAPLAFPLVNAWPRRTGDALAKWERA